MAFDPKPSSWIASWSEDGTTVTFPLASLTQELTAEEADADTGDMRSCLFSLLSHTHRYIDGLADDDKPSKMDCSMVVRQTASGKLSNRFVVTFETDIGTRNVSDE